MRVQRSRGPSRTSSGRPRAVTYHRVSTVDQHPENAREELQRAVAAKGLDLVEAIEETGSGRKNGLTFAWLHRGTGWVLEKIMEASDIVTDHTTGNT